MVIFIKTFFFFLFMATTMAYGSSWAGVISELHLRPIPQPKKDHIRATSATYTTACSNAGSLTHWARPGVEPASSQRQHQVLNLLSLSGNSFIRNFIYLVIRDKLIFPLLFCFWIDFWEEIIKVIKQLLNKLLNY